MLQALGFRIHHIPRIAHHLREEEFEQAMMSHQFQRNLQARLGQLHAAIGRMTQVAMLAEPLEKLHYAGVTELPTRLQRSQSLAHRRCGDTITPLTQLVDDLEAIYRSRR